MTTKTKAPVREGASKAKAPVREGLAFLIEDALERSEVVIAAESIVDKLQSIAEDLSTIEAKEIMPLLDSLTNAFGADVAQSFNSVATEQVRQLITAVQGAKTAMDNEILRLKQGVEGGDMSDMGMDAGAKPMMPAGAPGAGGGDMGGEPPAPAGALPDVPPDVGGNAEDDELAIGGGFAGRDKKVESRKAKGKKIAEDMGLPHSHESVNLDANIHNLAQYHPQAGRLAQQIRGMIRSEELSGADRKALAEVLSHVSGFGTQNSHWAGVDADKKLQMCLQSAGIWKVEGNVEKIVSNLKRLAHLLSMHHDGVLESNIAMLRKAADPDAVILKMFRTKLAEHKDAQMAAIRCAGAFAIDIEDVVAVVREAAARRPFPAKLSEFKADINPAKKGMFKGKNIDDIQTDLSKQKKRSQAAQDRGDKVPAEVKTKEKEDIFAIRAKKGWKGKVSEDGPPLMQGVPMFPVEQGSAASSITKNPMNAPTNSEPQTAAAPTFAPGQPVAGNSAPSATGAATNAPQSPATMRARQNAQQQQNAVRKAAQQPNNNQKPPPSTGQKQSSYTPPGEEDQQQDQPPSQKQRGFFPK